MKTRFKDTTNLTSKTNIKSVSRIPSSFNSSPSSQSSHFSLPLSAPLIKSDLYNKKRPLETNSQNLSFKGLFFKDVVDAKKVVKVFDRNKVFVEAKKHLGSNAERLFDHLIPLGDETGELLENPKLKKIVSRFITHTDGKVTFRKKSVPLLIYDGILYPFTILPADLLNGSVNMLKKIGPFKEWAESVSNSQTFKNIRMRSKVESQINSLRGIFETSESLKGKSEEVIKSTYLQTSIKMFDSSKGKYDTKHERSFNRVVSGSIPAIFLANDAYNLSIMCNDNKEEATKEQKARFRQEVSRVVTQAYITLITMGAISNYINKSKLAVMANVGLTALFTESVSRLSTGKFITRLTPEKAQQVNSGSPASKNADPESKNKPQTAEYKNVFFKSAEHRKPFASFAGVNPLITGDTEQKIQKAETAQSPNAEKSKTGTDKQKAPLMSFSTLLKLVGATVAAGFVLKGVRQNKVVDKLIKSALEPFNKLYAKLTTEANVKISKANFEKVVKALQDNGCNEIAQSYVDVSKTYRELQVSKNLDNMLSINLSEAKYDLIKLKDIGGSQKDKMLIDMFTKFDSSSAEWQEALKVLDSKGLDNLAKNYRAIIKDIEAHRAAFDNKALINNNAASAKDLETVAQKVEDLVDNYTNNIYLGKKDRPVAKPVVDFVVGPFKFIWDAIEGPYAWTNKLINMATGQTPEALAKKAAKVEKSVLELAKEADLEIIRRNDSDVKAIGKSIDYIGKAFKKELAAGTIDTNFKSQAFTDFVNDNIAKAFNIDTLSSVSNSDLANLSKTAVFATTIPFLMTDNYNMVMLKSNGKDKDGAELKAKERLVQEGSRFFYSTLLISLFNRTFNAQYNNSLMGMAWITAACTTVGEILNRKSVGVPVGTYSRDQILEMEKKRENASPMVKGYYNFMARLTGKKSLAEQQQAKMKSDKTEKSGNTAKA